jgi:diguanylate cyclase
MKKWVERFIEQFDWDSSGEGRTKHFKISEERATLLYMLDILNKHLFDVEGHPVRKVRETLDEYARDFLNPEEQDLERVLFRFRQFFTRHRIDEVTYVQKTFDAFRGIIWEFVDQLAEDVVSDRGDDSEVQDHFDQLKEAVESNSIDLLKNQSRKFIDSYIEHNFKKEKRRSTKVQKLSKNLDAVKQQLDEAEITARQDHLTGAYNRRSFDEHLHVERAVHSVTNKPMCMLSLDIDHFKKFNDNYGHAIGDFVLKEFVGILKGIFTKDKQFVARTGGEEFCVILSETDLGAAIRLAETVLSKVRNSAFVQDTTKLNFTVSIGVAQFHAGESEDGFMKRADEALYLSKKTGRNRMTVAEEDMGRAA